MKKSHVHLALGLACFLFTTGASFAQSTASPPTAAEPSEDIVALDPFEVAGDSIHGYATTSSLSASRTAVPITDLPASVITINERLIEDTVAVDLRDTFNLVSGVTHGNAGGGLQESNTFAVRGYLTSGALRDGIADLNFTQNGGFDYSMVERIEIVKGPAGVLYGQHSAGGAVNFISKKPLAKPATKIDLTLGSYSFWRTAIDHSSFLDRDKRLGYRISAAFMNTDGPIGIAGEPNDVSLWINPSISYQFKSGLKVWAWGAYVDDSSRRVSNSVWSFGTPDGRGQPFYQFLEEGTASVVYQNFNKTDNRNIELGASQHFNIFGATADLRVIGRWGTQETSGARTRSNGNTIFIDKAGNQIPDGNPNTGRGPNITGLITDNLSRFGRAGLRYNRGLDMSDEASFTADLNVGFDVGPTEHNLLFYTQYTDGTGDGRDSADIRVDNVATLPADIRERFRFNTGIAGVGISEIWPNPPSGVDDLRPIILQYANVTNLSPDTHSASSAFSAAVIERMSLLDNRLIFVGGIRYDDTSFENRRLDTNVITSDVTDSATVGRLGIVAKPFTSKTGELSLFFNNAETFVTETGLDQRLATFGEKFPNRTISTNEFGAKVNLFRNRIVGTISYFKNTEDNVLLNARDEDGSVTGIGDRSYLFPGGERTSDGWEMDLAFNPAEGLDVMLSLSKMDSLLSDGLPADGIPDSTMGAVVRYQFGEGPLSGFSVTGIYNRWGKSYLNRSSNFIIPSGDVFSVVLGYNWEKLSLRLRIENPTDDLAAQPSTWWTGVGVTRGRNYRLNATYRF